MREKKTDFFVIYAIIGDLSSLLILERHSPVDTALCSYKQPFGDRQPFGSPQRLKGTCQEPVRTRNLLFYD